MSFWNTRSAKMRGASAERRAPASRAATISRTWRNRVSAERYKEKKQTDFNSALLISITKFFLVVLSKHALILKPYSNPARLALTPSPPPLQLTQSSRLYRRRMAASAIENTKLASSTASPASEWGTISD